MNEGSQLPAIPLVQRGKTAERLNFSPTSEFRIICEGAANVPDFFEERSARGDGPPFHRHPWATWELVIAGALRVVVGDEEFRLAAGDSIYVPPGVPHGYVVESETAHVVGINLSDGRFPSLQRKAAAILASKDGPDMQKIMELATAHEVEVLGPPVGLKNAA